MKLARNASSAALLLLLGATSIGCGGDQPEAKTAGNEAPPPADTAPPPAPPPAETAKAEAPPPPPPEEKFTDEQIAMIVGTANAGEIDQAKVAQTNGKDAKVKAFAAHMITDHGQNQADSAKLLKKINLTPADSPISQKLKSDSADLVTKLKGEKGPDFDADYIAAQVAEHQAVLDLMDQKLIPQAKNADLKAAITAFRPKVEHHLSDAKTIQGGLAPKK